MSGLVGKKQAKESGSQEKFSDTDKSIRIRVLKKQTTHLPLLSQGFSVYAFNMSISVTYI